MDPASRFGADREGTFQVLWEDGDRVFCRGWRRGADGNRDAVLTVLPAAEHPPPATLDRLAHEYGLKDELDAAWAVRPLEFVRDRDRPMLVLEDSGGQPLERLLGTPMEMGRFLRLATGIVTALSKTHRRGLVHKDLKPANILVNRATGEVKLTGFGIASRLPRERPTLEPPEVIAGTLAYMAPEQTGRMNRSIDARSDLYSLGVTFYRMLTGSLPFTAAEPMEWVHCHIARKPVPPAERSVGIPAQVSAIIMKLLTKAVEDRYQTAAGVERDVRRCLAEWEVQGYVDDFPLGQQDTPDRLLIPEKLYGRSRELETLLAAFDRIVKSGAPELVLVSGYSGIGKSSVVNELHKVLVPTRGLFAAGKFDQYKRDIPYSTLAQAFQSLVRTLLGKSNKELSGWRDALLEALGPNGRLMVEVVPELKLIIGEQPPIPELPPQDAQRRFQMVFRRFIDVFARPEHPLALFLDDLQWLDAATLDLLEDLLTRSNLQHLMLIGAYRNNEVTAAHPLIRKLNAIRAAGGKVAQVTLEPLGRDHLGQLVVETLHCDAASAAQLAQLVHEKTGGNPFFAIQFLSSLAEEKMLTFDHGSLRWSWDLDRIYAKGYTDNVVDLMVAKLSRLPAETQNALQLLACLGNIADTTTLSIALGISEEQAHTALWPASCQGLVERRADAYRFAHDRVQEAAYTLIPPDLRAEAHLRIGRLLTAQTLAEQPREAVFETVNHLNRAAMLITSCDEREHLAELNLTAGKRAKASTAYSTALAYLVFGTTLLDSKCWEQRHELIFQLELNRAECEFLTGAVAESERRLAVLATRAANAVERAAVACLRVDVYTTLTQYDDAVAVCIGYLHYVGIDWSPHPTEEDVGREYERIWSQIGTRTIEELIDLPLMTNPASLATLDVLTKVLPPAQLTDAHLFYLAVTRAVNLSLESGNSDGSCVPYVLLGMVAGLHFGDYKAGFRFGKLGLDLVEERGLRRFEARVFLVFGSRVLPWTQPIRTGRSLVRRAFDTAQEVGDLTYAAYSCRNLITQLLASGDPLAEVQREAEAGLDFVRQVRFELVVDIVTTQLQFVRTLRGLTPVFGSFIDAAFDEEQFERHLEADPHLASCYWIRKLQARFFAGGYAAALEAASNARRLLWALPAHFEVAEYHFYAALARAAAWDDAPADRRQLHVEAVSAHRKHLEIWAGICPENFKSRAALVAAELARIDGRALDAMGLYEEAIRSARSNGFVHNEAIAYECASVFYRARGFEQIADLYLRNARYCYQRWGAEGKVRQLDERYRHLQEKEPLPVATGTMGAPVEHLDLATVLKVSQTVSGEMVLEKLIDTLMRTAIEHAGAVRGLLILPRARELRIAAEATTDGDAILIRLRDTPVTAGELPDAVLNYVLRTQESIILDDAAAGASGPFAADPYICQHQARSILCLPLINQVKLSGVLYLENNLAANVFMPTRIAMLKLLASQAAISLENSRLYRDLAEREAKIRRLVDANIIGINIWNSEGRILEANEAFLHMVGYSREDLASGRVRWTDLTPPEWRDFIPREMAELKMTGSLQPFEKEYFRKDGSRVPVLIGSALFDEQRDHGVAFVLDLTELKRAETALRASEERWRAMFAHAPTAIAMVGADYRLMETNPACHRMLGYSEHEFRQLTPMDISLDDDRDVTRALLPQLIDGTRESARTEKRYRTKDGGLVWADATFFHVPATEGLPGFATAIVVDITERKRAEEALRRAQSELARAARIISMGELTTTIAHEVNQPLAAIVASGNACRRWLATEPPNLTRAKESLNRIVGDADRASEVITRVRAHTKNTLPEQERVRINDIIDDVLFFTRGELEARQIMVQMELDRDVAPVLGDKVQLQQVILNLVMNAVEAMTPMTDRQRVLTMKSYNVPPTGVQVMVRDNGPGLNLGDSDRIFDAFVTTKPDGMGMGLSISRSIIEVHGGRLWTSPASPHGAEFHFALPTL